MAKIDTYEYIYEDTYPSGSTEARLIDDIFRAEKEALYNRQDQEHYWRRINDTEYEWEVEGMHRPESARVWNIPYTPGSDMYPQFPSVSSGTDKALFSITGEITATDDDGSQWIGTLWHAEEDKLVPAVRRLRGKVRINGAAFFGKENLRMDGSSAGEFTVDEGIPERGSNTPGIDSNNITLIPYYNLDDAEWGEEIEDEGTRQSLVYPVRVGNFSPVDGSFTAITETAAPTEGLAFLIGNYPTGDGTAFVLTRRGIEVLTSGDDNDTEDITFNGISLRKHNHSGGNMGVAVAALPVDPGNDSARVVWYKEAYANGPASTISSAINKFIDAGEGSLWPTGEDLSVIPITVTPELIIDVKSELTYCNVFIFRLRYEPATGDHVTLRQTAIPVQPEDTYATTNYLTTSWTLSPGELPSDVEALQLWISYLKTGSVFAVSGTYELRLRILGWRR